MGKLVTTSIVVCRTAENLRDLEEPIFRRRVRHYGTLSNRINCVKARKERNVGTISFDVCKNGCSFAVEIEEKGVWCSFGRDKSS